MDANKRQLLKEHNGRVLADLKRGTSSRASVVAVDDDGVPMLEFDNRMIAARYIVTEILDDVDTSDSKQIRDKAMKVYGNLYHGIKNSWRVYGYYWKLSNARTQCEEFLSNKPTEAFPSD